MGGDSIPALADAGDGYRRYTCRRWKSRRDCDGDLHEVTANALVAAVLNKLVEKVFRPEDLLRALEDAQPEDETCQALEREARRLTADLADVERSSAGWLMLWSAVVTAQALPSVSPTGRQNDRDCGCGCRTYRAVWSTRRLICRLSWCKITATMRVRLSNTGRWMMCGPCCARSWSGWR